MTSNVKITDIIGNILYNHNLLLNKIYRITSNLMFTDIIGNTLYNHNLLLNKIYRITSNIKSLTSSGTHCTTTNYCLTKSIE